MFNIWKIVISKKYADFTGRARRGEFWWFYLANGIIGWSLIILSLAAPFVLLAWLIFVIGTIIPILAVAVRRLHDTNRSGATVLLALVPIVGPIILIVFLASSGTPGDNRYGPPGDDNYGPPATIASSTTPLGWYPDPTGRHQSRYWNGAAWTDQAANDGATVTDSISNE